MAFDTLQLEAGGNINPGRFVKLDTSNNSTALQASTNEKAVGVSAMGSEDAPIPSNSTGYAATANNPVKIHTQGQIALVKVGSGGVTAGANVKSDSSGQAVLAATTGTTMQWVLGQALEAASEGEFARVLVQTFPHYPALA